MLPRFRMLVSVICLVFVVAACAAPATSPAGQAPAAPAAAQQEPQAAAAPVSVEGIPEVPRNRTLITAGLGGEHPGAFTDVELYNPYVPGISRSGFYQAGTEGLFYYNMIGDTFHPWLAEEYTYNDDFTEVIISLRDGAKWSDGTPFTANDVAFSLNALKGNPTLTNGTAVDVFVQDVEVVDDLTARITFNMPAPRFVWDYLTFRADLGIPMVPAHVWEGQDPTTFNNYDPEQGWPLVTGPYELVAATVEQKIWDRRDDWWAAEIGFQELPQIERLIFLPGMNEITMAQMLISNEIDMAFSMTPSNMQLIQSQNPNAITHSTEPPYGFMDWWPISLGFNTTIPPFDDPEIRWAISYAINRDELIQFAFSGFSSPALLPYPPYPGLQPYFDSISDLLEEYDPNEFNLEKSDAIMTEKGYTKDSEGFWARDGERVTFQIITFPQHPSTTPVAPVISEQLRRAGFDASFLLPADFVDRVYTGEAVAFLWGHGGSMKDPTRTLDLYHIRHVLPTGERALANIYRWSNQEFSDIVDEMASLPLDDPQITPLFHDAMEIWLPNLPDIPVVQTVIQVPMNTTYWTGWPNPDNPYIHEGFWHRTSMLLWMELEPVQ